MRTLVIIIGIIGIITVFAFLKANAQGFGLTPPGPQPPSYQPYTPYLNNPVIGAENPNAVDNDAFGSIAKGIGSVMLGSFQLDMLGKLLWGINYFIGFIGAILFTIAAFLVQIGLYFNTTILDTSVVQLGWRIIRDLANLGFTIGIVVIAYATILGIENYSIKKSLFWLIVAAVMVNFSFSIAGVFIDASNLVTHFFVSKSITGSNGAGALPFSSSNGPNVSLEGLRNSGAGELAETLADAFGPQRLLVVNDENRDAFAQLSSSAGMIVMVAAIFFIAFFTILATLGMLAVGVAILWRFIVLSGLMIVMPGAILAFGIAPTGTGNFWSKWKSEFITQLIHLPIITFFLYLTITFIKIQGKAAASGQLSVKDIAAVSGPSINQLLTIMAHPLQVMVEMVLLLGLLFWGLTQSRKWSAYGGGFIIDRIQGAGDWVRSAGKSKGAGAREWAARKVLNAGSEPDKNLGNRLGNIMSKIPIIRGLVPGLRTFMAGSKQNIEARTKEAQTLNDTQLTNIIKSPGMYRLSPEKMAGYGAEAARRGLLGKNVSMADFEPFIAPLKQFGMEKDVMKAAPHLFERFGWDISKLNAFMEKDFKPDDMDKVSADALKDKRVAFRLTAAHLKRLDGVNKKDHRRNFLETFNGLPEEDRKKFMANSFQKGKDIDDIHPEFFRNKNFVLELNTDHIKRIEKETDFAQAKAVLETLDETYKDLNVMQNPEHIKTLDSFAEIIISEGKDKQVWPGLAKAEDTKKIFASVAQEYRLPEESVTKYENQLLEQLTDDKQPKDPAWRETTLKKTYESYQHAEKNYELRRGKKFSGEKIPDTWEDLIKQYYGNSQPPPQSGAGASGSTPPPQHNPPQGSNEPQRTQRQNNLH